MTPLQPIPSIPSTPISSKAPGISAPLYVAPAAPGDAGHLDVPALRPGSKSEENHTDSTKSSSTPLSQKRSSRFRLPVPISSPGGRRTGLTPSEYSTLDFETRLASYSDDSEIVEPEDVKQKRRESTDDAWVDILVGAHARRMVGQDAQLKEGGGAGRRRGVRNRRSDPDIASLEVAQVLAGVRERTLSSPSPSVHGLNRHQPLERVDQDPVGGLERFYNDHDVDEVELVPRTSEARSEDDDTTDRSHSRDMQHHGGDADDEDEFESPSVAARLLAASLIQRRVGYFDLHPDRRPVVADVPRTSEDDLRDKLAYDADSDDEPTPTPQTQFSVPPEPTVPPPRPPAVPQHSTITALEVQVEPKVNVTQLSTPESVKSIPQSRTAALIEMYRERERNTPPKPSTPPAPIPIPVLAPIAPLQPSRLPVRSVSKEPLVPPAPVVEVVTQPPTPPEVVEPVYEPPPRVNYGETGRASPARYVHGAPLHNVLEEEEE